MSGILKPGDFAVLALAGILTTGLFFHAWIQPKGSEAMVRAKGKLVYLVPLDRDGSFSAEGILGSSQIEVHRGRLRVSADPGPRQICVKQGWISQAGESLLCLANQVSVEIRGAANVLDSIGY